jgi:hemolysin activation/secretion protein
MSIRKLLGTSILSGLVIVPGVAYGQAQIQAGVIDRPAPKVEAPAERVAKSAPGKPLQDAPQPGESSDNTEVVSNLKGVKFTGNTVIGNDQLQAIAAPYIGKPLTKAGLAQLKFEVTSAFYDRGYILVKTVTPPQDLSDGVLDVNIYEARVGAVNVEDNGVVRPHVTNGIAKRVHKGDVIRERNIESMVSDMNDLQNVEATLALQPGHEFGTTDLNVSLRDAKEDVNYVSIDNYGSELTGRGVGTLHLEKSNLLHMGETFGATLRATNEDFYSGEATAVVPTGFYNTQFEASYLYSNYDVVGRLKALDASGETQRAIFALSSKLINTRNDKVTVRGGTEIRRHKTELSNVTDSVDDIRQLFVESSYLHRAIASVWYASAKLSRGFDVFGATDKGDPLASRALGDPEAFRLEPVLYANIRPIENGTIKLLATGQIADHTLLSSDLFVLGGMGSVRGFEPAQETGENGYQFTVEYNHELPIPDNSVWKLRAGPFVDGGAVYNRVAGSSVDSHLLSAGLTFEAVGDLIPQGNTKLRLDWAHPIGDYDSPEVDDNTFYAGLTQYF